MERFFNIDDDKNLIEDEGGHFTDYDFYDEDGQAEYEVQSPINNSTEGLEYEFVDETFNDIDFSEFRGDFKSSLKKLHGKIKNKAPKIRRVVKKKLPLNNSIGIEQSATLYGKNGTQKTAGRIIIPRDRQVIIEGVNKFVLNDKNDIYKNVGYYKGKKLRQLVFTFNNSGSNDFNLEIFNPSEPLDYLYATSGNINNKITVSGGKASYTDILFYVLANPTHIPNARFVVSGPTQAAILAQQNQNLFFTNKSTDGKQFVSPMDMAQELDPYQFQGTVINFDVIGNLKRPYIPDGMDVIQYKVLAGNTVTLCFFFEQHQLKRFFFEEAKNNKNLL